VKKMPQEVAAYQKVASLDEIPTIDIPFVLESTGIVAGGAFIENFLQQRKSKAGETYIHPKIQELIYSLPTDAEGDDQEESPRFMDYLFDHLKDDKEFHKGYIGLEERVGDYRQL